VDLTDIPRIPGSWGVIFRFIKAVHDEFDPSLSCGPIVGLIASRAATHCFAFIEGAASSRGSAPLDPKPSCWGGRRPQLGDRHQDFFEHLPPHADLARISASTCRR
jgi:hypothetical protein